MKKVIICFFILTIIYPAPGFCVYFDDSSDNDGFQETTPQTPKTGEINYNKTDTSQITPTHSPRMVTHSDIYDFNKAHKIKHRNPRYIQN